MKLIENTPTHLVYSKTYRWNEGSTMIPGGQIEYPCALLINVGVTVAVLFIVPALAYPLNSIVCGTTVAWLFACIWMTQREGWKKQIRGEQVIVDKLALALSNRITFNSGEVRERHYPAQNINALNAKDAAEDYWIMLDANSLTYGRVNWTLAGFKNAAERDAMLGELNAALHISVKPET